FPQERRRVPGLLNGVRLPTPSVRSKGALPSRQQLRELVVVLRGEVLALEARGERAAIRHDEVIDVPGDDDVGRQLRRVAKNLRDEHAALAVERAALSEVVDALEKLPLRAMDRRQCRELFFERLPDRKRIEKNLAAVERRDEQLRPEGLFDLLPEEGRHLQAP